MSVVFLLLSLQAMSLGVLEDDADPNYTHFAHRDEFLALLEKFLEVPQDGNEKKSDDLVKAMGSIVSLCEALFLLQLMGVARCIPTLARPC